MLKVLSKSPQTFLYKRDSEEPPLIHMLNISKFFPGIVALDNVNFEIRKGEIHGLLGENGAGKTTLMKILCGIYSLDSGEIFYEGKKINILSTKDAYKYGIVMVNQYPQLIDKLTVAENIALSLKNIKLLSKFSILSKKIRGLAEKYGFEIDPDTPIWRLSFSERQRVEILKALLLNAKVIIFDEPTTLLTSREKKLLYQFMNKIAGEGNGVVLITHKLGEALEVTDRITILRNGKVITTVNTCDVNYKKLVKYMFEGREDRSVLPPQIHRKMYRTRCVLEVNNLVVRNDLNEISVRNVSFKLHTGEILGIAGVAGNGQVELAEAIAGLRRAVNGKIIILGRDLTNADVGIRKDLLGYVPDRITQSLILDMPLYENFILKTYSNSNFSRWGFINYDVVLKVSEELISKYHIAAPNSRVNAGHLSGGNLQKLILARELSLKPPVLIIMNPTRALDHYSAKFVYSILYKYKNDGGAVLLISEDLEEVIKLSDTIAVIYNGNLKVLGDKKNVDLDIIEDYIVGKAGAA